jgi:hypothetical protein
VVLFLGALPVEEMPQDGIVAVEPLLQGAVHEHIAVFQINKAVADDFNTFLLPTTKSVLTITFLS